MFAPRNVEFLGGRTLSTDLSKLLCLGQLPAAAAAADTTEIVLNPQIRKSQCNMSCWWSCTQSGSQVVVARRRSSV